MRGRNQRMWSLVGETLLASERFVLTTHVSSDGDGIGCELALSRQLRRMGKSVHVINPTATQERYAFLYEPGEIRHYEPSLDAVILAADVILVLDINRWDRLGPMTELVRASRAVKVCIDHHPAPEYFGPADISEPRASATGVLVYDLIRHLAGDVPLDAVDPLYVAIMTDTGSFRFANTNHESMSIATDLVARGAKPDILYRAVYETSSPGRMRLLGEVLTSLTYELDGRFVHFSITRKALETCGVDREESEGFTDIVRGVEGSVVVVSFVELDADRTKVSLRSKGTTVDVSELARAFGGGGHANASGIVLDRPLDVARRVIKDAIAERL